MTTNKIIQFPGMHATVSEMAGERAPTETVNRLRPAHAPVKCRVRDINEVREALFRTRVAIGKAEDMLTDLIGGEV